jgi:hypothetical protein
MTKVITVNALWDLIRKHNARTNPWTEAKCIVMLRKEDLKSVVDEFNAEEKNSRCAFADSDVLDWSDRD